MQPSHKFLQDMGIDHLEVDTDIKDNNGVDHGLGRRRYGETCDDECLEILGIGTVVIGLLVAACKSHKNISILYQHY